MRAIIELKDGNIATRVGIEGFFDQFVDEWLESNGDMTAAIWCVMDEDGETWDPEDEPYWTQGCTRRLTIYGPAGSGVIELPWTGETWEVLMEREYPKTYALMEALEAGAAQEGPVLDDEEASLLFKEDGE